MFGPDLKDPAILRDLFAAVIAGFIELGCKMVPWGGNSSPDKKAEWAYTLSDAMLKARSKK